MRTEQPPETQTILGQLRGMVTHSRLEFLRNELQWRNLVPRQPSQDVTQNSC